MVTIQLDDYYCNNCKKTGMGELDIKTQKYRCLMCGKQEDECVLNEDDDEIKIINYNFVENDEGKMEITVEINGQTFKGIIGAIS